MFPSDGRKPSTTAEAAAASVKASRNGLRRPSWSATVPARGMATITISTTTAWVRARYQSGRSRSLMIHVGRKRISSRNEKIE